MPSHLPILQNFKACVALSLLLTLFVSPSNAASPNALSSDRILEAYPFRNLEEDLSDMEGGLKIFKWGMSLNLGPSGSLDPYAYGNYLGRKYYYPTLQANPQVVARLEARFFEIFELTAGIGYSFFQTRAKLMQNEVNKSDQYQYLTMSSLFPMAGIRIYLPFWNALHPFAGGTLKFNQTTFSVAEDFLDLGQNQPRYLSTSATNLLSWQIEAGLEFPLARYFGARFAFFYEPMSLDSLPTQLVAAPSSDQPKIKLYTAFNQIGFSGSFYVQF